MLQPPRLHRLPVPRNPWLLVLGIAAALTVGTVVLALVAALAAVAATIAFLAGSAWLAWKIGRGLWGSNRRTYTRRSREAVHQMGRRVDRREARGLLEMARTPNPLEQYLLGVREFERISAESLSLDPESAGSRRTARRVWALMEQADSLSDAVTGVERRLMSDPTAHGARTHAWELALASREVCHYLEQLADVRRRPNLGELRALITHRAELLERRAALVDRLDSVEMRRSTPALR